MPIFKKDLNTHYNRHIFDLQSDIQNSVLKRTKLFLLDIYIWNRTNSTKRLMFGKHPAIMPEAIPFRLIKMFSFIGDLVLDPFAGSGTTLKIAKNLDRNFVGYELYENYKDIIEAKLNES